MADFPPLLLRHLGRQDYETTWRAMKDFTDARTADTADECWVLEHNPVFTLGQAGKEEHVLQVSAIPLVRTDRGGQVTYHGPGQLVIYFLLDIKRRNIGVRELVAFIEQAVITMLDRLGITAELKPGAPGVYVQGAKIASLGLRVRRGCTYHGLSVNVDMDLAPFSCINPCGYPGLAITQIAQLLPGKPAMTSVEQGILAAFSDLLQAHAVPGQ